MSGKSEYDILLDKYKDLSLLTDSELESLHADALRLKNLYGDIEQAKKLDSNALYGYFGGEYGLFSDVVLAADITGEAASSLKEAQRITNNYWQNDFHGDVDLHNAIQERFKDVIFDISNYKKARKKYNTITQYSDTDSIYINGYSFLYAYGLPKFVEKSANLTLDIVNFIDSYRLERLFVEGFDKYCESRNIKENLFVFEKEGVFTTGVFLAKKKYILAVAESDYVNVIAKKKIKAKGVELARGAHSAKAKEIITKLSRLVLKHDENEPPDKFIAILYKIKQNLMELDRTEIYDILSERISIKKFDNYVVRKSDTEYEFLPRCSASIRGAANYNIHVNKHKIMGEYPELNNKTKVKYYYTANGDVFAYNPEYGLPPFAPDMNIDKQYEKIVLNPMGRISRDITAGVDIRKANNRYTTIVNNNGRKIKK